MVTPRIGGSFAPSIDEAKLATYRTLAESAPDMVRVEMLKLCDMVAVFWETPRSTLPGTPHPVGQVQVNGRVISTWVTPLAQEEIDRIWDHVPWSSAVPGEHLNECEALGQLFGGISNETNKPLRDAAFHLLWIGVELSKDREPLFSDQITP